MKQRTDIGTVVGATMSVGAAGYGLTLVVNALAENAGLRRAVFGIGAVALVCLVICVKQSMRTPKETFFLGEYEIDADADLSDGAWVRVRKSQGDRKWGRKMVKIIGQKVTFL